MVLCIASNIRAAGRIKPTNSKSPRIWGVAPDSHSKLFRVKSFSCASSNCYWEKGRIPFRKMIPTPSLQYGSIPFLYVITLVPNIFQDAGIQLDLTRHSDSIYRTIPRDFPRNRLRYVVSRGPGFLIEPNDLPLCVRLSEWFGVTPTPAPKRSEPNQATDEDQELVFGYSNDGYGAQLHAPGFRPAERRG
jgi:hypothetical protein